MSELRREELDKLIDECDREAVSYEDWKERLISAILDKRTVLRDEDCPYESVLEGAGARAHAIWAMSGFHYCPECTMPLKNKVTSPQEAEAEGKSSKVAGVVG